MTIETLHGPWDWAGQAQYAQAARVGELVFTGGIGPFDSEGELIDSDTETQIRQTLDNLATVLASFGCGLDNIVGMNVFVSDPEAYTVFKSVRPQVLTAPYPASTAIEAGRLLVEGMRIEINAIACTGARRVPAQSSQMASVPAGAAGKSGATS
jgi:2-iminobutanoate/2-iminopropanoate deaminase